MGDVKDNEVNVDGKTIGPNTVIQVNLKTLVIVIGIIISSITTAWWKLSDQVSDASKSAKEDVKSIRDDLNQLKAEDLKVLSVQVNQVDGKVQTMFMFLQQTNTNQNSGARSGNNVPNIAPGTFRNGNN